MTNSALLAVDRTIELDINGSRQQLRLCAARTGLPPLLIVQAGPGLPLLHEVARFQRLLNLEQRFLVGYWEQRGCGAATANDARSASWPRQVDDLQKVLQWLYGETRQSVLMFGISLGATIVLQMVEREASRITAVIAISPDSQTTFSDTAAHTFLQDQARRSDRRRLRRRVMALSEPPYLEPSALQRRASVLADLGTIEHNRTFTGLLRETLFAMVRTYGVIGAVRALRNMNIVQRKLLPEITALDLFAHPPRVTVPVHYVFGEQDALNTAAMAMELPAAIAAPGSTVVRLPSAGHMVHFDQPAIVRGIVEHA